MCRLCARDDIERSGRELESLRGQQNTGITLCWNGRQGQPIDGLRQEIELRELRGDRCGVVRSKIVGQGQIGLCDFGSVGDKGVILRVGQNIDSVPSRLFQQTGKGLGRNVGSRQTVLFQGRLYYLDLLRQDLGRGALRHGGLVRHGRQHVVFQLVPEWIGLAGGGRVSLGRQVQLGRTRCGELRAVSAGGRRRRFGGGLFLADGFLGFGSRSRGFGDGFGSALGAG